MLGHRAIVIVCSLGRKQSGLPKCWTLIHTLMAVECWQTLRCWAILMRIRAVSALGFQTNRVHVYLQHLLQQGQSRIHSSAATADTSAYDQGVVNISGLSDVYCIPSRFSILFPNVSKYPYPHRAGDPADPALEQALTCGRHLVLSSNGTRQG